jgi:agmatine deiminase
MISDFDTNTIYFSEHLKTDSLFKKTHDQLISVLNELELAPKYLLGTNDVWVRDFMPIQIAENNFVEYRYDPDYLQGNSNKKNTREIKTYPDIVCDLHHFKTKKSQIILDGGNVVRSNDCIILTDKILWENKRMFSTKELNQKLHEDFEVEKVVTIPWDDYCKYGHSDGMLRFVNSDSVLISGFYEQYDKDIVKPMIKKLEKAKLNWDWFRCSKKEVADNATYINFLQTKDIIIMPVLNGPEDEMAFSELSKFFPIYAEKNQIKRVNAQELTKFGGALNCVSWTIKE